MNDQTDYPSLLAAAYGNAFSIVQQASSLEEAKAQLDAVASGLTRLPNEDGGSQAKLRKKGFYEQLGTYILSEVERVVSRETLVEDTIRMLAEDPESRIAQYYLVIEAFLGDDDQLLDIKVVTQSGIHPQRLANFVNQKLAGLTHSPIVRDVLVNRETVEFLPTVFLRGISYFSEFDDLGDARGRGSWLCALPLPAADATRPSRMLIAMYPVSGTTDSPSIPRGAQQEWRSLIFLRVAYEMLNHQLRGTREQVIAQRRELLADLAPGLVNHEINQQLTILDQSTNMMNWSVHELNDQGYGDLHEFNVLVEALNNTLGAVTRLHHIADAFNNLERRPSKVPVPLVKILEECAELVFYRLSRVGAKLTIQGNKLVEVMTDAALLEHVFINIIANAIEEMGKEGQKLPKARIQVSISQDGDVARIIIANNGHPILLSRPERIFQKGFTTKPRGIGHGLGLHICRMIMTYLGGTIGLVEEQDLPKGMTVGFLIVCPLSREIEDDITET